MVRASIVFVLVTLLTICATVATCTQNDIMDIQVSPNVLNLKSNGGAFTIHADIKYDSDLDVEVYLNNNYNSVSILSTFADSTGDLVVRCDILDVKETVSEGSVTIKLTVRTEDGAIYSGTDAIDIIRIGR